MTRRCGVIDVEFDGGAYHSVPAARQEKTSRRRLQQSPRKARHPYAVNTLGGCIRRCHAGWHRRRSTGNARGSRANGLRIAPRGRRASAGRPRARCARLRWRRRIGCGRRGWHRCAAVRGCHRRGWGSHGRRRRARGGRRCHVPLAPHPLGAGFAAVDETVFAQQPTYGRGGDLAPVEASVGFERAHDECHRGIGMFAGDVDDELPLGWGE